MIELAKTSLKSWLSRFKMLIPNLWHSAGSVQDVITREAIYYGPTDSSFKASLINWALPYAQRYMHSTHPSNYTQLKQNGYEAIKKLQIVVVEKLFYKNVIKRCGNSSQNRYECSCLLQDETLYSTVAADPHALFLELSRLFLNGTPDLHLANFLHMITTMAESGSTVDQTEFFILNCQKIPKLPEEEVMWSLSSPSSIQNGESSQRDFESMGMDEEEPCMKPGTVSSTVENGSKSLKYQMKAGVIRSNWPPADWKTAPGFGPHAGNCRIQEPTCGGIEKDQISTDMILTEGEVPSVNNGYWTIRDDSGTSTSPGCENVDGYVSLAYDQNCGVDGTVDPEHLDIMPDRHQPSSLGFARRDRFAITGGSSDQAMATGRSGEQLAFRYLIGKYGKEAVRWVNEENETGLPYDILVTVRGGEHEHGGGQYFEVKATQSARKDFFFISSREWQFAAEKGDDYTIVHVLLGNHNAMVTLFKNPVKQCQQGKLRLVVVMPTQQGGEAFPVLDG
ncbi:Protein NO VEIN [Linum perenne]